MQTIEYRGLCINIIACHAAAVHTWLIFLSIPSNKHTPVTVSISSAIFLSCAITVLMAAEVSIEATRNRVTC